MGHKNYSKYSQFFNKPEDTKEEVTEVTEVEKVEEIVPEENNEVLNVEEIEPALLPSSFSGSFSEFANITPNIIAAITTNTIIIIAITLVLLSFSIILSS